MQLGDGGATSGVQRAGENDGAGSSTEGGAAETGGVGGVAVEVAMRQSGGDGGGEQLGEKAKGKQKRRSPAARKNTGGTGDQRAARRREKADEGS